MVAAVRVLQPFEFGFEVYLSGCMEKFLLLYIAELFQTGTLKVDLEHQEQISKRQLPDIFRCPLSVTSHADVIHELKPMNQFNHLQAKKAPSFFSWSTRIDEECQKLPLIDICDELMHEYQISTSWSFETSFSPTEISPCGCDSKA